MIDTSAEEEKRALVQRPDNVHYTPDPVGDDTVAKWVKAQRLMLARAKISS